MDKYDSFDFESLIWKDYFEQVNLVPESWFLGPEFLQMENSIQISAPFQHY